MTETLETEVGSAPANVEVSGDNSTSPQAASDNPISQAQARSLVEAAHKRLGEARVAVKVLQERERDAKAVLATAIANWQRNADAGTAEDRRSRELRAHIASEQARKQAMADAGIRGPRMNTSKHAAFDPISGRSGPKGSSRGAFPASYQHRNTKTLHLFQGKPATKA